MMDRATYFRILFGKREDILSQVLQNSLAGTGLPPKQIDDESARVLQLLTMLLQPRKVIEIGTYFGYSAIHIARGLSSEGHLTTLEIDPHLADVARRNIALAGVSDRIDVVTGDARAYLSSLYPESVDLIFIDADKRSYPDYLRLSFGLLRPGGVMIADDSYADANFSREGNTLAAEHEAVQAINTYNRAMVHSPMFFSALFGTGNGFLVSRKQDICSLASFTNTMNP